MKKGVDYVNCELCGNWTFNVESATCPGCAKKLNKEPVPCDCDQLPCSYNPAKCSGCSRMPKKLKRRKLCRTH